MTTSKIKFFQSEIIDWKKTVEFYAHQLNAFNGRLTELKSGDGEAEHFSNRFITAKDNFIALRADLHSQEESIVSAAPDYDNITSNFVDKQFHLADRMQEAELSFSELKRAFYQFIETQSAAIKDQQIQA